MFLIQSDGTDSMLKQIWRRAKRSELCIPMVARHQTPCKVVMSKDSMASFADLFMSIAWTSQKSKVVQNGMGTLEARAEWQTHSSHRWSVSTTCPATVNTAATWKLWNQRVANNCRTAHKLAVLQPIVWNIFGEGRKRISPNKISASLLVCTKFCVPTYLIHNGHKANEVEIEQNYWTYEADLRWKPIKEWQWGRNPLSFLGRTLYKYT